MYMTGNDKSLGGCIDNSEKIHTESLSAGELKLTRRKSSNNQGIIIILIS